jgi:hypothetical protein
MAAAGFANLGSEISDFKRSGELRVERPGYLLGQGQGIGATTDYERKSDPRGFVL